MKSTKADLVHGNCAKELLLLVSHPSFLYGRSRVQGLLKIKWVCECAQLEKKIEEKDIVVNQKTNAPEDVQNN